MGQRRSSRLPLWAPCGGKYHDQQKKICGSKRSPIASFTLAPETPAVGLAAGVSNEEAQKQYPKVWKAPKPYLRIVSQPK
jgi:hypothetical protein